MLSQSTTEIKAPLNPVQRSLYEKIPQQIRADMLQAFQLAAAQSGTGVKRRMLDILERHSQAVAHTMFLDAEQQILEGACRGLTEALTPPLRGDDEGRLNGMPAP